jgi:hypothetical protein
MWNKFRSRGTEWIVISWRPRTVGKRRLQLCTHMLVISISERNLAQDQDHFLSSLAFRGDLWLSTARYWVIFHKYDRNLIEVALTFKSLCETLGTDPRKTNVENKCLYFTMIVCTHRCFWKFGIELFRFKNSLNYKHYISEMGFWMRRQTTGEK